MKVQENSTKTLMRGTDGTPKDGLMLPGRVSSRRYISDHADCAFDRAGGGDESPSARALAASAFAARRRRPFDPPDQEYIKMLVGFSLAEAAFGPGGATRRHSPAAAQYTQLAGSRLAPGQYAAEFASHGNRSHHHHCPKGSRTTTAAAARARESSDGCGSFCLDGLAKEEVADPRQQQQVERDSMPVMEAMAAGQAPTAAADLNSPPSSVPRSRSRRQLFFAGQEVCSSVGIDPALLTPRYLRRGRYTLDLSAAPKGVAVDGVGASSPRSAGGEGEATAGGPTFTRRLFRKWSDAVSSETSGRYRKGSSYSRSSVHEGCIADGVIAACDQPIFEVTASTELDDDAADDSTTDDRRPENTSSSGNDAPAGETMIPSDPDQPQSQPLLSRTSPGARPLEPPPLPYDDHSLGEEPERSKRPSTADTGQGPSDTLSIAPQAAEPQRAEQEAGLEDRREEARPAAVRENDQAAAAAVARGAQRSLDPPMSRVNSLGTSVSGVGSGGSGVVLRITRKGARRARRMLPAAQQPPVAAE